MNVEYIIKYFEEHNEQNSYHFQNVESWISIEKYPKLFHQYDIFDEQIKQPLFRKRFIIQLLIVLNSFMTPINKYQKEAFKFVQNQKEKEKESIIINLIKKCILYLHKKYDIYFGDIIKNENKWSKWKENSCPEIEQMIHTKIEKENLKKNEKENKEEDKDKEKEDIKSKIANIKSKLSNYNLKFLNAK